MLTVRCRNSDRQLCASGVQALWAGLCRRHGQVLGCKTSAEAAIGAQNFQRGQGAGLETHQAAGVGHLRHITHAEMLTLPAVGALGLRGVRVHVRASRASERMHSVMLL